MLSATPLTLVLVGGVGLFVLAYVAERFGRPPRNHLMALVLTRKPGESVVIGDATVWCTHARGGRIKFHIDAPRHIRITRSELIERDRADDARATRQPAADLQDAD